MPPNDYLHAPPEERHHSRAVPYPHFPPFLHSSLIILPSPWPPPGIPHPFSHHRHNAGQFHGLRWQSGSVDTALGGAQRRGQGSQIAPACRAISFHSCPEPRAQSPKPDFIRSSVQNPRLFPCLPSLQWFKSLVFSALRLTNSPFPDLPPRSFANWNLIILWSLNVGAWSFPHPSIRG